MLVFPPLLAMVSCQSAAAPARTETGVCRELADLRARVLSQVRYLVRLSVPEEASGAVTGETIARFRWDDPLRRDVVLDFLEPSARTRRLEVNGARAEWRGENDHIVIPAAALRARGDNEIRLAYSAGEEALNRAEDFLYTLFVPERHHQSLPVFDQPDLKACWRLEVEVPAGWVAVANGAEQRVDDVAGAGDPIGAPCQPDAPSPDAPPRRRYRFGETRPIPSYLFALAAGCFAVEESEQDGRRLRMYHRESDARRVARNRDRVFELHRAALSWMEDYTGIPYPFGKLDLVLLPALQYSGMEHPGAIFYRQGGVLLDDSATQEDQLRRANVIAHETAHMWFGGLVTMTWFDDVWIKEVLADLAAAEIVRRNFPGIDHDLRFLLSHHPAAYAVDRAVGANPIRQPLENLRGAGALYGPVIYHKAPVVMRQLERRIGEAALRDGLRDYLARFAYGNAAWPDLVEILGERSRWGVEEWSRVWVEEAGRPTVRVRRERATARTRFVLEQVDPDGRGRVWPQDLVVAVKAPASRAPPEDPKPQGASLRSVTLGEGRVSLEVGGHPAWLLPNAGGLEYAFFRLDAASREALLEDVSEVGTGRIRAAAWLTLWEAVLEGEIAPARFLSRVLASLPAEPDEQITAHLLGLIGTVYWKLLPDVERAWHGPGAELALWDGARSASTTTLRAAYFWCWHDIVESCDGVARLRRLWSGEEPAPILLAGPDRTRLAAALSLRSAVEWRDVLEREEAQIDDPDRKVRLAFLRPALSADPADRERFFLSLAEPANREREPWVLDGLRYVNHPLRARHARTLLRPALILLEEVERTGDVFFPEAWIGATLSGHSDPEAAGVVAAFLEERPAYPPRLRAKILQASDLLERAARLAHGWRPGNFAAARGVINTASTISH